MEKIGVGIVGLSASRGWAAGAHVPALQALNDDYDLAALCTTNAESSRTAAAAFGARHAFCDHEQMVRCPDVDLVVVAVKVPHHREIVTAAIEAGKNVLCEWPLGRDLAEAEQMTALARDRGVRGFIGLQARSSPAFSYLRELISKGFIGTPTLLNVSGTGGAWGARTDRANAYTADIRNGATLLTIPVAHTVDGICSILGDVREVVASVENGRGSIEIVENGERVPLTSPDKVAMIARLVNGSTMTLTYRGGTAPDNGLAMEIHGTDGELKVIGKSGHAQIVDLAIEGARGDEPMRSLPVPNLHFHTTLRQGPAMNIAENYWRIARDLKDGGSLAPTFEDALRRHYFVEAVERSAHQSSWITLPTGRPGSG